MDSLANLISSLASLAWPVVFAVLVYKLFSPIQKLVESANARKFTIKVAGNELTMEELSEQQRIIINDIQSKIVEIEKRDVVESPAAAALSIEQPRSKKRVLWVDDRPKNNSFLVAAIEDKGAKVEIALSTDEALSKIQKEDFDIVISDMGRPEGDHAGLDLANRLKAMKIAIPIYIYCGTWAAKNLRKEAESAGVAGITSSGTTLLSMLQITGP